MTPIIENPLTVPSHFRRTDWQREEPAPEAPASRRWPSLVALAASVAGLTALVVSSQYDDRSMGTRVDATIAALHGVWDSQVQLVKTSAVQATDRVSVRFSDTGITTAVKAAFAADPALSAMSIDVYTQEGVVRLAGPAPDERARRRAEMLAAAPQGVRAVDNRLDIPGPQRLN